MKRERNKPCWCGSGKKSKMCHLNREKQPKPGIDQRIKDHRAANNIRACLVENLDSHPCSGGIVRAHSISRRASLELISRKQHVYGFPGSFTNLLKGRGFRPELVGV